MWILQDAMRSLRFAGFAILKIATVDSPIFGEWETVGICHHFDYLIFVTRGICGDVATLLCINEFGKLSL